MRKQTKFILFCSAVVVCGVIALQVAWVSNYYFVNKERFLKISKQALHEAVDQEYDYRCDELQMQMTIFLNDSTNFNVQSKYQTAVKRYLYVIADRQKPSDAVSFSIATINRELKPGDTLLKKKIVAQFANDYRRNNIEKGKIFFQPQRLGFFIDSAMQAYYFDSTVFQLFLTTNLKELGAGSGYRLVFSQKTLPQNNSTESSQLAVTEEINTGISTELFVTAVFNSAGQYALSNMIYLLIGSVLLIFVLVFSFYWILRSLFIEKKLSLIKNDFISNITHEFKTPIATVSAALEALDVFNAVDDPVKRKKYFDTARTEIKRISEMVNKILNISIYEKKHVELIKETVRPDALIRQLTYNYEMIRTKEIGWQIDADPDFQIRTDKELLYIALSNIIDNAVKYSGDRPVIRIRVKDKQDKAIFSIEDNGKGIPPDQLKLVFEKFYRVPDPDFKKVKGYGLGLSYTRSIIENLGGICEIKSEQYSGTNFIFSIPAK